MTVEQHQHDGLIARSHEDVALSCDKDRFNLYAAVVKQPLQVPILILLLVELLKLR